MSRVSAITETATWYPAPSGWTTVARSTAPDPQRALAFQSALRQAAARQVVPARPIATATQNRPISPVPDDFSLVELPIWPLGGTVSRPTRLRPALASAS